MISTPLLSLSQHQPLKETRLPTASLDFATIFRTLLGTGLLINCCLAFLCRCRSSAWRLMLPGRTKRFLQCLSHCTMSVCVRPAESSYLSSSSPPGRYCRTSWRSIWCPTETLRFADLLCLRTLYPGGSSGAFWSWRTNSCCRSLTKIWTRLSLL